MGVDDFLRGIKRCHQRFFPEARLIAVEKLPFYIKTRIIISEKLFVEIRYNVRNKRYSYVMVDNGRRIAGFDNLGGWHRHYFKKANSHQPIKAPSLDEIFNYFQKGIKPLQKL